MAGGGNEMSRGRGLFQFLAISLKRKQKRKKSLVTGSKNTRMQTKLMIAKWVNVLYSVCVCVGGGVFMAPLFPYVTFVGPLALSQLHYFIAFSLGLEGKAMQELYTHYDFSLVLEVRLLFCTLWGTAAAQSCWSSH